MLDLNLTIYHCYGKKKTTMKVLIKLQNHIGACSCRRREPWPANLTSSRACSAEPPVPFRTSAESETDACLALSAR